MSIPTLASTHDQENTRLTRAQGWNGKKGITAGRDMRDVCGIWYVGLFGSGTTSIPLSYSSIIRYSFESAVKPNKSRCCGQLFCYQHLSDVSRRGRESCFVAERMTVVVSDRVGWALSYMSCASITRNGHYFPSPSCKAQTFRCPFLTDPTPLTPPFSPEFTVPSAYPYSVIWLRLEFKSRI
jgi:hypothetical protein